MKRILFILLIIPTLLMGQDRVVQTKIFHNNIVRYRDTFVDATVGDTHSREWVMGTGSYVIDSLVTESGLPYFNVGDKYLQNTVAGTIATQSTSAYGSWEFNIYKGADANSLDVLFQSSMIEAIDEGGTGYELIFRSDERIQFVEINAGADIQLSRTSVSYFAINTWYGIKITRTTVGIFTIYIKGGSFGDAYTLVDVSGGSGTNPTTDNTYTESQFFVIDSDALDKFTDLKIWR